MRGGWEWREGGGATNRQTSRYIFIYIQMTKEMKRNNFHLFFTFLFFIFVLFFCWPPFFSHTAAETPAETQTIGGGAEKWRGGGWHTVVAHIFHIFQRGATTKKSIRKTTIKKI